MCETQDDFGATILHRCVAIPTNFSNKDNLEYAIETACNSYED